MIPADQFYEPVSGPLRQGDIVLARVVRVVAGDRFVPAAWRDLDEDHVPVAGPHGTSYLATGTALVMVTSHDCHIDKEWNRMVSRLRREGVDDETAMATADADDALDRGVQVSPLAPPDAIDVDRGNLMAGRVQGYLPVAASPDGLVPEAVVDLTYRCTVDRLDLTPIASISTDARALLRVMLVHLDALRSPMVSAVIEQAVGKRIDRAHVADRAPLKVRLELDDGSVVELMQVPGEPGPGPSRQAAPAA